MVPATEVLPDLNDPFGMAAFSEGMAGAGGADGGLMSNINVTDDWTTLLNSMGILFDTGEKF